MENNTDTNNGVNSQNINNSTPEGNGGQNEKTFTQDEVNRIVSERLAKERAKAEPTTEQLRENELTARENEMTCKEFIIENKYPVELLELFNTNNAENFKNKVTELFKIFPQINEPINNAVLETNKSAPNDKLAEIFKPKI